MTAAPGHAMQTPRIFLCYAPRAGLRCALAYLAGPRDAYGWFIGRDDGGAIRSAYFVLEDYYTAGQTRYTEIADGDLHTKWTRDEARCHELARLEEAFRREWLVVASDVDAPAQLGRYERDEIAAGEVAIRVERLNRLSKDGVDWTYYSHDCEHGVLEFLSARWPLDYRIASA